MSHGLMGESFVMHSKTEVCNAEKKCFSMQSFSKVNLVVVMVLLIFFLCVTSIVSAEPGKRPLRKVKSIADSSAALSQDEIVRLSKIGDSYLDPKSPSYQLAEKLKQLKTLLSNKEYGKIKDIAERAIAETQMSDRNESNDKGILYQLLRSDMNLMFAKALEGSRAPKNEIIAAYKKWASSKNTLSKEYPLSRNQSALSWLLTPLEFASSMVWLSQNMPEAEYVDIVRESVRGVSVSRPRMSNLTMAFMELEDWGAFKVYLDLLLTEAANPAKYAAIIDKQLSRGVWAKKYLEYCKGNSMLESLAVQSLMASIGDMEPYAAMRTLERVIGDFEKKLERNPQEKMDTKGVNPSDMYFVLAELMLDAGEPKEKVIAAYKRWISQKQRMEVYAADSESKPLFLLSPQAYASSMVWLSQNMPEAEYVDIVRESVRGVSVGEKALHKLTMAFMELEDWGAFEVYLEGVFAEVSDQTLYAVATDKILSKGEWAKKYWEYCKGKLPIEHCAMWSLRAAIEDMDSTEAIESLRSIIDSHEKWVDKNPRKLSQISSMLDSVMYFELAEALRNSNKPKSDVIAAYKRWSSKKQHLMNLAGDSYSSRPFLIKPRAFASAMRWLYRNLPKNECEAIVRKSIHGVNLSEHQVSDITKGFKKLEDWNAYQLFLDVLFSEIGDVVTCAIAIEKSLKNHYWSEKILKYAEGNPVMAEYAVKRSTNVDRNQKTVKAYHSYLKQKNSKEESSSYEYEVVKTYFDSGQHEKGMVALDEYIDNNIESHKTEAMKGLMLKGRVLTQIDKIDKALKVYNKVVTAFEKEGLYNWEAKFQMGYCYMLQGNEEEARRILEQVVESCSDLPIGNKASLCLMNLK